MNLKPVKQLKNGKGMSLSHKQPFPKITKQLEKDFFTLHSLYENEEIENVKPVIQAVWDRANYIFQNENRDAPYYLIFMMRPLSDRFQTMVCKFAIFPSINSTGEPVKDCLVWYCDKKNRVFKLATELCDLRRRDGLL